MPPAGSVQLASASAARETEIGDPHDAVLVEQQVGRLHVAVEHVARVRVLERRRDVVSDSGRLRDVEQRPLIEHRPEAAALEELEDHERHVVLAPVVDRHDVGVTQRRGELGLGPEPPQKRGVVGERGVQHLHRDPAAQSLVVGHVHAAARAGTNRAVKQVATGQHPARQEIAGSTSRHPTNRSVTATCRRVTARHARSSPQSRRSCRREHGRYRSTVKLRRPEHPERVAVVAVVALVVANLAYFGTKKEVRGTVAPERPAAILELSPQEGEDIIPEAPIVADLRDNYTGQLSIDGHLIPQDQVSITHPNLFELSFHPTPGHDIHRFAPGSHVATIEYWPVHQAYEAAKANHKLGTYTWNFKVG